MAESEEPGAAAVYDELADTYDSTYVDAESRSEDRYMVRLLRKEVRAASRIADLGCGTGWTLDYFAAAEHLIGPGTRRSYWGLDISQGMLDRLLEKHPWATVVRGDVNQWWPHRGSFDLVTSTFCSPSYSDPKTLITAAAHGLHPGGRLVLMPWAPGNEQREHYLPGSAAYDYYAWTQDETRELLYDAGFMDVKIRGLRHPRLKPKQSAPDWAHDMWLRAERVLPADDCAFLIVTATRGVDAEEISCSAAEESAPTAYPSPGFKVHRAEGAA